MARYTSSAMRMDLHVHTRESHSAPEHWLAELLGVQESYTQPEAALDAALRKGLDGVAITNHDSAEDALRMARENPHEVMPGCEYTVYGGRDRYVHVVVLGIDESGHQELSREKARGVSRFAETARRLGSACFLAHPAWEVGPGKQGIDPAALCEWLAHFELIEICNGQCPAENEVAGGLARYFRKAGVGGSDSHDAAAIGISWTESPARTIDGFMKDLLEGNVRPGGTPAGFEEFAASAREVIAGFYRREFLRAARPAPSGRAGPSRTLGGLLRNALEMLILPGFLWVPKLESRAHFRRLKERTERLRRGLIDHLGLEMARSVAAISTDIDERSRAWAEGMREIHLAFGGY